MAQKVTYSKIGAFVFFLNEYIALKGQSNKIFEP